MDKRAQKILFDTFWSPTGWRNATDDGSSSEDFEYAKAKGLMFDPAQLDHSRTQTDLLTSIAKLNRRTVSDAFLASLSTRRLDWRSPLGSFAVFQNLPRHNFEGSSIHCGVCGFFREERAVDLNVLNFERLKWGGVRHDQVAYAAMDLGLFLKNPPPPPTPDDINIFKDLLAAITEVPSSINSAALHRYFPESLKANKAERDVVVGILGYCGILGTPAQPGYSASFVSVSERRLPHRRFVDMAYPSCWWSGEVGINSARLIEYFGHVV